MSENMFWDYRSLEYSNRHAFVNRDECPCLANLYIEKYSIVSWDLFILESIKKDDPEDFFSRLNVKDNANLSIMCSCYNRNYKIYYHIMQAKAFKLIQAIKKRTKTYKIVADQRGLARAVLRLYISGNYDLIQFYGDLKIFTVDTYMDISRCDVFAMTIHKTLHIHALTQGEDYSFLDVVLKTSKARLKVDVTLKVGKREVDPVMHRSSSVRTQFTPNVFSFADLREACNTYNITFSSEIPCRTIMFGSFYI